MPIQPSNSFSIQLLDADFNPVGAPQTLAALGIESLTFDLNNLAADVWSLTVGGMAIDAGALWPYGQSLVVLNPAGVRVFFGRVEPWTRDGQPGLQNHLGRLVNPWWYLANKIYQQRYTLGQFANYPGTGDPMPETYVTYTTPRVVLNVLWNPPAGFNPAPGAPPIFPDQPAGFMSANTGQQIKDALEWAILQGAPITIGQIEPATLPYSDFQKGITCAAVIQKMYRFEPDFVIDWDYSTVPFPTVHFRKNFIPLTIDLTNIEIQERVKIVERTDWQKSYFNINYDQTDSQDGSQYLAIFNDLYPNPIPAGTEAAFRGVDLYCDLSGSSVSSTSQTAEFASLPFDLTSWETWRTWKPDLDPAIHPEIAGVQIQPGILISTNNELDGNGFAVPYNPLCAFELVDGSWADWIPNVIAQRVRITGSATVIKNKGVAGLSIETISISHDLTVVNLNTGGISKSFTNTNTQITAYAEPVPVGLAQAMWTSWNNLSVEGNFTDVEAMVGLNQPITRSNSLNFKTAGGVDWSNVNAGIQRISGDIGRGMTSVQFGAPLDLTGHELIDAIRASRFRATTIDLGYLFGGALPGSGASNVKLSRKMHARHAQAGTPHPQSAVVSGNPSPTAADSFVRTDGTTGTTVWQMTNGPQGFMPVTIDPRKVKGSDGNLHQVQLQEAKVCVTVAGVLKQRTVVALISEVYRAPDDPA